MGVSDAMSIKQDAGIILNVLYNRKIGGNKEQISSSKIISESGLDGVRIMNALEYLKEKGLISVGFMPLDGVWKVIKITALGVDLVEDRKEFKKHFEIGVNLLLVNFRWGGEER